MKFVVAAIYVAMAVPSVPLILAWRRVFRSTTTRPRPVVRIALVASTASYLWLLAILAFGSVLAPDYSNLRFGTIYFNLAAMSVAFWMAMSRGGLVRGPLVGGTASLVMLWLYLAAVSSVV